MIKKDLAEIVGRIANGDVEYWTVEGEVIPCAVTLREGVVVRDILETVYQCFGDPEDE